MKLVDRIRAEVFFVRAWWRGLPMCLRGLESELALGVLMGSGWRARRALYVLRAMRLVRWVAGGIWSIWLFFDNDDNYDNEE